MDCPSQHAAATVSLPYWCTPGDVTLRSTGTMGEWETNSEVVLVSVAALSSQGLVTSCNTYLLELDGTRFCSPFRAVERETFVRWNLRPPCGGTRAYAFNFHAEVYMQLPLLYAYACILGASIEHTIVVPCLTGAGRNAAWPLPKSEICRAALGAQSANDPRAG